MRDYKCRIIKQYIEKNIQSSTERQILLIERVLPLCLIQTAIKNQYLESPGPALDGRVWYSPQTVIHSFYFNKKKGLNCGTQIWKKNEVILFPPSLLQGEPRINFIQILESGVILSMSYKDILTIRDEFPEILSAFEQLIIQNQHAIQHRNRLLNEPSDERVAKFEAENSLFCAITSIATKAMHVGLSRQGYSNVKRNS